MYRAKRVTMLISPVHRSDDYPPVMGRYLHSSPHVHGGKLPYAVHCLGRHPAHGKQWRDKENGIQEIWGSIDQSSMSKEEIIVVSSLCLLGLCFRTRTPRG